jgi:hypothetical protein
MAINHANTSALCFILVSAIAKALPEFRVLSVRFIRHVKIYSSRFIHHVKIYSSDGTASRFIRQDLFVRRDWGFGDVDDAGQDDAGHP